MKLKTNKLLIFSLILVIGTFLLAMFSEDLGLSKKFNRYLVFPYLIAYGLNVSGLTFGIIEKKENGNKAQIGIIGNLVVIVMFIIIVVIAYSKS